MNTYITSVSAQIGDGEVETTQNVDSYIIIKDGNVYIEGILQKDISKIVALLSKVAVEQAIAAEYAIRTSEDAGELYEDIQQDVADIEGFAVSYSGHFD